MSQEPASDQTSLCFWLQQIYEWCGSHKTTDVAIWNSQKYIKWYKKVAMHFNQLALSWLASLCIRRIREGSPAFEHDIIVYCKSTFWTQKWRSWPAQGGTHCKVHWATLYRHHPSNRGKAETPKQCRVCYKKVLHKESHYQCSGCPSNPGLCY